MRRLLITFTFFLLLLVPASGLAHDHADKPFTELCYVEPSVDPNRGSGNLNYEVLWNPMDCDFNIKGSLDIDHERSAQFRFIYEDLFRRGNLMSETTAGRIGHVVTGRINLGERKPATRSIPPAGPAPPDTGFQFVTSYQLDCAWNWDITSGDYTWPIGVQTPPCRVYFFDPTGAWVGLLEFPWLNPRTGAADLIYRWFHVLNELQRRDGINVFTASGGFSSGFVDVEDFSGKLCDLDGDGICGLSDFGLFQGSFNE